MKSSILLFVLLAAALLIGCEELVDPTAKPPVEQPPEQPPPRT